MRYGRPCLDRSTVQQSKYFCINSPSTSRRTRHHVTCSTREECVVWLPWDVGLIWRPLLSPFVSPACYMPCDPKQTSASIPTDLAVKNSRIFAQQASVEAYSRASPCRRCCRQESRQPPTARPPPAPPTRRACSKSRKTWRLKHNRREGFGQNASHKRVTLTGACVCVWPGRYLRSKRSRLARLA